MRATFPAGTLTGAPKIRAMQIIAELEQTARGPYGGCVGYFSFGGNLDCCITIRTALLKGRPRLCAGRRRLGRRLDARGRISGDSQQSQSHAQSRGHGGEFQAIVLKMEPCQNEPDQSLAHFSCDAAHSQCVPVQRECHFLGRRLNY